MSAEELRNWFKNLIFHFREEYGKLDENEKRFVDSLSNLNPPLQVHAFWFHNSALNVDLHIILFTKWEETDDAEINIYGPIEFSKCVDQMEIILSDTKWEKEVPSKHTYWPPGTKLKYKDTIKNLFINSFNNFKREFKYWLFRETNLPSYINKYSLQTWECFTWICPGDIIKLDSTSDVEHTIKHAKDKAKLMSINEDTSSKKTTRIIPSKIETIKGYGTYFFPPVWLDKQPQLNLKEKIFGTRLKSKNGDILEAKYKDRIVIIEKDGFIGISEENKDDALNLLNEIMAMSQFYDYPFQYIREHDVGNIEINPETLKIQSISLHGPNKRLDLFDERWGDLSQIPLYGRIELPKEDIEKIIDQANKLIINDELSNLLSIYLGTATHFDNREFSMAFLMSWTLIEKKIEEEYLKVIKDQINDIKRKNKLESRKFQTIDDKIEILRLIDYLNKDQYDKFMELKGIRNRIIHRGEKVKKEEAEVCLELSTIIIKELIGF